MAAVEVAAVTTEAGGAVAGADEEEEGAAIVSVTYAALLSFRCSSYYGSLSISVEFSFRAGAVLLTGGSAA